MAIASEYAKDVRERTTPKNAKDIVVFSRMRLGSALIFFFPQEDKTKAFVSIKESCLNSLLINNEIPLLEQEKQKIMLP